MATLWEKIVQLCFWKKKMPKEGKDSELTGIMILKGDYAGVVYHYGKVRVKEQGALATLQFGYTIVNSGKHDIDLLQKDEEFSTMMGDILTEILLKHDNEKIRNHDPEEFDLQ